MSSACSPAGHKPSAASHLHPAHHGHWRAPRSVPVALVGGDDVSWPCCQDGKQSVIMAMPSPCLEDLEARQVGAAESGEGLFSLGLAVIGCDQLAFVPANRGCTNSPITRMGNSRRAARRASSAASHLVKRAR